MFKWLNRPLGKGKQKTEQVLTGEVEKDEAIQDKASQKDSSDSIRLLLQTAIADAEKIAESIKISAQKEAEAEAARIIAKTKLEIEEMKGKAEIASQKQAEEIISAANRKAEITEAQVKQRALQFLIRAGQEMEKKVGEDYKSAYSKLSSSLQGLIDEGQNIATELKEKTEKLLKSKSFELKEYEAALLSTSETALPAVEIADPAVTGSKTRQATKEKMEMAAQPQQEVEEEEAEEPAKLEEEKTEEPAKLEEEKAEEPIKLEEEKAEEPIKPKEKKVKEPARIKEEKVEKTTPLKPDSQDPYDGEVELTIATPVELKLVSRLYNYLQTIPELRVLYTRGSWDQGTTIAIVMEEPIPLINILTETPGVEVTAELFDRDSLSGGRPGLPLRGGERKAKRIKLTLKET
ncbi:hypothetical protein ACFLUN_00325 [Chloroflexota bacterium]